MANKQDSAIIIRKLEKGDDRSQFDCGHEALNHYFRSYAGQNQFRHHLAQHLVCVNAETHILGFASYCAGSIERANYPDELSKYPGYPLPILRLGRFAISVHAQGLGLGRALIKQVLCEALELQSHAGCIGVLVDAKPDARGFYTQYGWTPLQQLAQGYGPEETTPMWLPISTIKKAARP